MNNGKKGNRNSQGVVDYKEDKLVLLRKLKKVLIRQPIFKCNISSYYFFTAAIPYTSQKLAHGYETNVQGKFDDHKPGVDIYVKGMKIWIRRWDGRPVYGGRLLINGHKLQVFDWLSDHIYILNAILTH